MGIFEVKSHLHMYAFFSFFAGLQFFSMLCIGSHLLIYTHAKPDFSRQQNTKCGKVLIMSTSNLFVYKQNSFPECVTLIGKCKKEVEMVLFFRYYINTCENSCTDKVRQI